MSILIALKTERNVILASDGLIIRGYDVCATDTRKWHTQEDRAIGSGGLSVLNLIKTFSYSDLKSPSAVIKAIRQRIRKNLPDFEIGLVIGRDFYVIDKYLTWLQVQQIFIGDGADVARGAMAALPFYNHDVKKKVIRAIEITQECNISCGGSIFVYELE